jgi:hypothetical protein
MDDEIKQLRDKLDEAQRKKKEEDERNKDPFRYLHERIERRSQMIPILESHIEHAVRNGLSTQINRDGIESIMKENACDTAILNAILQLQADVEALRKSLSPVHTDWPFLEGYRCLPPHDSCTYSNSYPFTCDRA